MKKSKNENKGFTLTEILVVIVILGIILLIAIPSILSISKSAKKRELEAKKEALILAAEAYAKDNIDEFGGADILKLKVRTLIYYGYVKPDEACSEEIGCIINPTNNNSMNDEIITVKKNFAVTQATWGLEEAQMNVTFYSNGADKFNGDDSKSLSCNESGCVVNSPKITRNGYTIVGWGASENAREALYEPEASIPLNQKNQEYYAITKKEATATFYPNNGIFEDGTNSNKQIPCFLYNTSSACIVNAPNISRGSYSFTGWNTSSNGSGTNYNDRNISISGSTGLYAQWSLNLYTLTLYYNGYGNNITSGINFTSKLGDNWKLGYSNENKGYVLKGIDDEKVTTTIYNNTKVSENYGLMDYNAGWMNFTKENYIAKPGAEWYVKNGNSKTEFDQADGSVTSNQIANAAGCDLNNRDCSVTLYVNWTQKVYEITLNKNGGSGGRGKIYEKYGVNWYANENDTNNITSISTPTKSSCTFSGYYTLSSGGTQIINSSGSILSEKTTTFNSNGTLYAHWNCSESGETDPWLGCSCSGVPGTTCKKSYLKYNSIGTLCDTRSNPVHCCE